MKTSDQIRICLTGGASGGHLFPLVFVSRELKKLLDKYDYKIFYLGSKPFDEELLRKEGIDVYLIPEIKFRRYPSFKNLLDLIKLPFSFLISYYHIFRLMPNVIFSKGGPGSLPVVLNGWFFRIPIVIHESDSIPGLSNRISAKFADLIILAFEEAKKYFNYKKTLVLGHPIDYYSLVNTEISDDDYKTFSLKKDKNVVLFLGGSQGSQFINDLVIEVLPELLNFTQVIHQIGKKNFKDTYLYAEGIILEKNPDKLNDYHPIPFIDNQVLIKLMMLSNLIVARAGAGTIFEIAAIGRPSILIPLSEKVSNQHQIVNADIYDQAGACKVLREDNAKPHILLKEIKDILNDDELVKNMSLAALKFSKPDAVIKITEEILRFV